jgi:GNAT superfamily N-acetyltransferase
MDQHELSLRRTQMGRVCAALAGGINMEYQVEAGWWLALTGAPSPDLNMAFLYQPDSAALSEVLRRIAARGCPAFVMLAGEGRSLERELPDGWVSVGTTPMMAVDLTTTATAPDPRVRLARVDEAELLTALVAESYGMPRQIAAVAMAPLARGDSGLQVWLLEDDGEVVSTISTVRCEDSVSLWTMATPVRFGRRGYGQALLAGVLHHARDEGAKIALLHASPAALSIFESTGWRTEDVWTVFTNHTSA